MADLGMVTQKKILRPFGQSNMRLEVPNSSRIAKYIKIGALTGNQKKVYDSIASGVTGDALEPSTGLTATEVSQAVEELTKAGLLQVPVPEVVPVKEAV